MNKPKKSILFIFKNEGSSWNKPISLGFLMGSMASKTS